MSLIPWQAWAGLFGLAGAGLFWWWLTRALKKQGADELRTEAAEKSAKVKDDQLSIANDRPRDAADLVERLRRNGL